MSRKTINNLGIKDRSNIVNHERITRNEVILKDGTICVHTTISTNSILTGKIVSTVHSYYVDTQAVTRKTFLEVIQETK